MKLKVMLMYEEEIRSFMLIESLNQAGFEVSARAPCNEGVLSTLKLCEPDVLVIDMEMPDDRIFDQLLEINIKHPCPIVFFADKGESRFIKKAVQSGVSAFVVDGLTERRIKPVIEMAMERFKAMQVLYAELNETKTKLKDRKTIERAKGILMSRNNVDENSAYKSLRKIAMEQNKKLIDIANSVVELSEVL